jgi:tRNA(adenine34) deaminase
VDYQSLMQQALLLAKQSSDNGDVPVGALIANEFGEILGRGRNLREERNDPTAHAEIVALREAGEKVGSWRLDDLTMVVTLEPCAMCAGAILQSRIKRLIFGAWNEKAGAVGSVWDVIRDNRSLHEVEVISKCLEVECVLLMNNFFINQRKK